jgi:hypothetical protein
MPFPALNSTFDGLVPKGMQHYWKADFATDLTDDAIGTGTVLRPTVAENRSSPSRRHRASDRLVTATQPIRIRGESEKWLING